MNLFSKKEAYLGVDIGAQGIKFVELHKVKARPQLWTYGIVDESLDIHIQSKGEKNADDLLAEGSNPWVSKDKKEKEAPIFYQDPRIDKYALLLKELLKKARVTTRKTTASIPVSYVFHAIVTLPHMEDKEIEGAVRAEVKKMLPRPVEEMQIISQKIPESDDDKNKKYLRALVTAVPKELVAFYSGIFQKAGLELGELETEAFALERSLVGHDKTTAMIVDVGAERTSFFIIDGGLPLTHRTISAGGYAIDNILSDVLGIGPEEVSQVKHDMSRLREMPGEIFSRITDSIVREIEYSLDLFLHQSGMEGKRPEKIILTGGSGVFPFIAQRIKESFPLKVFVGDPWARVVYPESLRPVLDEIGSRMAVSIGLAMRNIVG